MSNTFSLSTFNGLDRYREFIVARGAGRPPITKLRRFPVAGSGVAHGRKGIAWESKKPNDAMNELNAPHPGNMYSPHAWIESEGFKLVHRFDPPPKDFKMTEAVIAKYSSAGQDLVVAAFAVFEAPDAGFSPGDTHNASVYAAFDGVFADEDIDFGDLDDLGECSFESILKEVRDASQAPADSRVANSTNGGAATTSLPAIEAKFELVVKGYFTRSYSRWQREESIKSVTHAPGAWF